MKRTDLSMDLRIISVIIIFSSALFSCNQPVKELMVVTFSGCSFVDNLAMHNAEFGSLADSGETTALLVSDGDLLYVVDDEGDIIMQFVYDKDLGRHLDFSVDTIVPGYIRINGKIHSLYISADSLMLDWITSTNEEEIAQLRFINLIEESKSYVLDWLSRVAEINPNSGVSFSDSSLFYDYLPMIHPTSLVLTDFELDDHINDYIPNLDKVELLCVDVERITNWDFMYQMPNLKSLILSYWYPETKHPLQIDKIPGLESLVIVESDLTSLDVLGKPAKLNSLYLTYCDKLTDISALENLSGLRCLGLQGCDTVFDLSAINKIPALQWLSLPDHTSQAEFEDIIAHHQSLEALELLYCDEIKDLSSITHLMNLKTLTIGGEKIDYGTLKQLTGIELIVIDKNSFEEDEEEIAAMKEALPDTHIVPGGGFCMGSGWILLILPVLLLAFGYRRFIRK